MKLLALLAASMAFGPAALAADDAVAKPTSATFHVRQSTVLSDIPPGTKLVEWWIAIPGDSRYQDILDFRVVPGPGAWRIVTEPEHGNRFLYVEVADPRTGSLSATVEFTVRRESTAVEVDPAMAGPITDSHRRIFADELRRDAPHMRVDDAIQRMADETCGGEDNVATQARLLLDAVADRVNHYSIDPSVPKCSPGDAEACLEQGGGCCTDLHSLFIALARARGIPARLQVGYRLREANVGKEVDPGYRCWAEYFVPAYGWIPTDIVEADDPDGPGRARWFSGLTERRVWLNQGRGFDLAGSAATARRVDTMVVGHAEIDGEPARVLPDATGQRPAQITRTVHFTASR
ncbi:MAG TPA: transglutaminase domain-containing protein [Planctomycetota bacterium]|nr:transglutaminase domain-containing protein [Planctomycetota bacterium]